MRVRRPEAMAAASGVLVAGVVTFSVAGTAWAVLVGAFGAMLAAAILANDD